MWISPNGKIREEGMTGAEEARQVDLECIVIGMGAWSPMVASSDAYFSLGG